MRWIENMCIEIYIIYINYIYTYIYNHLKSSTIIYTCIDTDIHVYLLPVLNKNTALAMPPSPLPSFQSLRDLFGTPPVQGF